MHPHKRGQEQWVTAPSGLVPNITVHSSEALCSRQQRFQQTTAQRTGQLFGAKETTCHKFHCQSLCWKLKKCSMKLGLAVPWATYTLES